MNRLHIIVLAVAAFSAGAADPRYQPLDRTGRHAPLATRWVHATDSGSDLLSVAWNDLSTESFSIFATDAKAPASVRIGQAQVRIKFPFGPITWPTKSDWETDPGSVDFYSDSTWRVWRLSWNILHESRFGITDGESGELDSNNVWIAEHVPTEKWIAFAYEGSQDDPESSHSDSSIRWVSALRSTPAAMGLVLLQPSTHGIKISHRIHTHSMTLKK